MWPIWGWLAAIAIISMLFALALVVKQSPGRKSVLILTGVLVIAAITSWLGSGSQPRNEPQVAPLPIISGESRRLPLRRQDGDFVGAATCRNCHAKEHSSWHHSFHRSMTQIVTRESVLADFDNVTLTTRGRDYRLWREGDTFWADMVDPDWDAEQKATGLNAAAADLPRVRRQIVMSTGSHHFQTYWINGGKGNELWQVPWVYHLAEKRWMPAEDAFVAPPDGPRRLTKWNDNCIQCHAVGGQPGIDSEDQSFTSRVADLAIACEACHGPGRAHVAFRQSRSGNSALSSKEEVDPIVNPARLPHDRASQICGQCHSYFSFADDRFWQTGFAYRAGDNLHDTRLVHDYQHEYVQSRPDLQAGYWRDGTNRLAGREFSAMDDSKCYLTGKLSCLSCHSLHDYKDRDDQLAIGMGENQACLQCHATFQDRIEEHTHHVANSSGSKCYNCHMPHTSFGLLKAIRSHRIDSPSVRMTSEHGRPNACNLCHVNETLAWTSKYLEDWYGHSPAVLAPDDQRISLALHMLLEGDAAQRAVVAWNLGRPEVVGRTPQWPPPFLGLALLDSYAAVRFTAYQSLRRYPGFQEFHYDFLSPPKDRVDAMRRAIEQWRSQLSVTPSWSGAPFLLRADGTMEIEDVQRLMGSRDNRPILLPE